MAKGGKFTYWQMPLTESESLDKRRRNAVTNNVTSYRFAHPDTIPAFKSLSTDHFRIVREQHGRRWED